MKALADRICMLLAEGRPAVVATILDRKGSAPRTAGSKMVIDDAGGFVGTIGGGKFEADVLAEAHAAVARRSPAKLFFDLTSHDVSAMDMICGGKMEVLVDYVAPGGREAAVFEAWSAALHNPIPGALVTVMTGGGRDIEKTAHAMIYPEGALVGDWPLSDTLRHRLARTIQRETASRVSEAEGARLLVEPVAPSNTVFLFGAGHVSMPTARLAAEVGFRVVVIDDREEFANRERFPEAADIRVPEDFASAFSGLSIDAGSFVVIVTRGHRYDREVLSGALRTGAGYIGMIGSRRKRDAIFTALEEEGFLDADLSRVHSPIGLSIGADTPEEIAVSIVAELIQHRAEMKKE